MADQLSINVNIIDDSSYEIEIPDTSTIPSLGGTKWIDKWGNMNLPDGFESIPLALVSVGDGNDWGLLIWTESDGGNTGVVYQDEFYYYEPTEGRLADKVVFTVKDGKIVNNEGVGGLKFTQELQRTLRLDRNWKKENLHIVLTLVSRGVMKKVDSLFFENPTPEQITSIISLVPVSRSLQWEAVNLTSSQWEEVAEKFSNESFTFGLGGTTLNGESAESVAKICSKATRVLLSYMKFEDMGGFVDHLVEYLSREEARCGMIEFTRSSYDEYSEEFRKMEEKLGWNADRDPYMGYSDDILIHFTKNVE